MSNSNLQCIYPSCSINRYSRGLCKPHYMVAFHLVETKETTWEELAENKRCLPKRGEKMTGAQEWFLSDNSNH